MATLISVHNSDGCNTAKYADEWIEKYKDEKGLPDAVGSVNQKIFQTTLKL